MLKCGKIFVQSQFLTFLGQVDLPRCYRTSPFFSPRCSNVPCVEVQDYCTPFQTWLSLRRTFSNISTSRQIRSIHRWWRSVFHQFPRTYHHNTTGLKGKLQTGTTELIATNTTFVLNLSHKIVSLSVWPRHKQHNWLLRSCSLFETANLSVYLIFRTPRTICRGLAVPQARYPVQSAHEGLAELVGVQVAHLGVGVSYVALIIGVVHGTGQHVGVRENRLLGLVV